MIGVKAKLEEKWEDLKKDFSDLHNDVHGFTKEFNPFGGYDQLGVKPMKPMSNKEAVLYSTYTQLLLVGDLRPDLKYKK